MNIDLPVTRRLKSFLETAASDDPTNESFDYHFAPTLLEQVTAIGREKYIKTVTAIHSMETVAVDAASPLESRVTFKAESGVFRLSAVVEGSAPNRLTRLAISRLKPGVDYGIYPVHLPGKRVVVREFRLDDAEGLYRALSSAEVVEHTTWPQAKTLDEVSRWLPAMVTNANKIERDSYNLVLADTKTDELIGGCGIWKEDERYREGSINYYISPELWGKGLATEAAELILLFGFSELKLHRITATVDPGNLASIRVLEKIGMQREGLLRGKYDVRGEWKDRLLYSILEEVG